MTDKQPEALIWARQLELLLPFMRPAVFTASSKAIAELRRLHELNAELVEALRVVIRGVPDTWDGVKQAKAVLAKAQGEKND
jgi:hypothetical protein